jgi:hypothetical protein
MSAIKHQIKTIRQGDPNFHLTDGVVLYPRAMLHVLPECPRAYRDALQMAFDGGYIKLVAHVQGKELTWETLTT